MLAIAIPADDPSAPGDISYASGQIVADGSDLETAVMLSLFVDADALTGDVVPEGVARRGWWGNSFGGSIPGSRLWLLETCVPTTANGQRAESYAREALQWMVTGRLVRSVATNSMARADQLYIGVEIELKSRKTVSLGPFRVGSQS